MKYALYIRQNGSTKTFKRHCRIDYNRKGLLTTYPIRYETIEDAQFDAELFRNDGYDTEIKEVK